MDSDERAGEWTLSLEEADSRDRATVALVNAKVATVDARVRGLESLIRSEFKTVREDIKALAGLTAIVVKLQVEVDDLKRRVEAEESKGQRFLTLVISGAAAVGSLAAMVISLTHG